MFECLDVEYLSACMLDVWVLECWMFECLNVGCLRCFVNMYHLFHWLSSKIICGVYTYLWMEQFCLLSTFICGVYIYL